MGRATCGPKGPHDVEGRGEEWEAEDRMKKEYWAMLC